MKQNLQAIIVPYIILAILAGLLLWYVKRQITKAGGNILEGLGFKDSDEDTEINEKVEKLTVSAFSPKFYEQSPKGSLLLTSATGDKLAKQLKDSVGWLNDNEQQFVDVFKQLKTKSQVSYLAYKFAKNYKLDMLTFIQNYFGDEWGTTANKEYNAVIKYVNNLPNYKPS